jgi:hypothetical protein
MPFELMNRHKFELDVNPLGVANYALLAVGISNVSPANNEALSQDNYLSGAGFGETDVIGAQVVLAFTGHRNYGDQAQDFIFSKSLEIGTSRRTNFKWTEPNGGVFTGSCTIANISGPSGDAGAKGEISFEIHFNGKPTYSGPTVDSTLPTVTTSPVDGSAAFAVGSNIVWTFSEQIQPHLVNDANFFVMVASSGALVTGTLTLSAGNTVVTFDPTANLTAATPYIAVATRAIKDNAGNSMATNSVTNFTTA